MARAKHGLVIIFIVAGVLVATAAIAGATIRLTNLEPGPDRFQFHGRLTYEAGTAVVDHGMTIEIRNANGLVFATTLAPHSCVQHGNNYCKFVDQNAGRTHTGIASFKMSFQKHKIWLTAYGDLSLAAVPRMSVVVRLNGIASAVIADFAQTSNGWVLTNKNWT